MGSRDSLIAVAIVGHPNGQGTMAGDGPTLGAMVDDDFDAGRFADAFQTFLTRFVEALPPQSGTLRRLAIEHLGEDPSELPTFTQRFHTSEHANLQLAFDSLVADVPEWHLFGLPAELQHFGEFSLASIYSAPETRFARS